jgi:subtilisin family serine protease
MFAQAGNNIGIQGVLGFNLPNMCLYVARIFNDAGEGQRDSVVLSAAEWCADQGARVINMSLGSPGSGDPYAEQVYDNIRAEGALIFSASGNNGDSSYNYPAAFDSVIAVSAVNQYEQVAGFSNRNEKVDIAAPGETILSTVPVQGVTDDSGNQYNALLMEFSITPNVPISARVQNCGHATTDYDCVGANGKVCVIERGGTGTFADKAQRCATKGGIAAIVYNSEPQLFAGTLVFPDFVSIPVVSVSRDDGLRILQSSTATISLAESGYAELSGTSMAVPFVSGVAAGIWAARPECTNEQVLQALLDTAKPLGDSQSYGRGLVQAKAAYRALLKMPPPCGNGAGARSRTNSNNTLSRANSNGGTSDKNSPSQQSWWWSRNSGNRNLRRSRNNNNTEMSITRFAS